MNSVKHGHPFYFFLLTWSGKIGRPEVFSMGFENFFTRTASWLYCYSTIFGYKVIAILIALLAGVNLLVKRKLDDILLFLVIIFLFFITTISHMPIYDRYILAFIPAVVLLAAVSFTNVLKINTPKKLYILLAVVFVVFMAGPVRKGIFKYNLKNLQGNLMGAADTRNDGFDAMSRYVRAKKAPLGMYYHRHISWVPYYYFYGAPEGFSWINTGGMGCEEQAEEIAKSSYRDNYVLYYANKDYSGSLRPLLKKKGISLREEYSVYNRFDKKNLVLYRAVFLK